MNYFYEDCLHIDIVFLYMTYNNNNNNNTRKILKAKVIKPGQIHGLCYGL